MENKTENNALEEKVEDVIRDKMDILLLRGKLNLIGNQRKKAKSQNNEDTLQRYKTIVDYFTKNKDRVESNREYLVDVTYSLSNCFCKLDASDKDLDEKIEYNAAVKNLCDKVSNMLAQSNDALFKEAFLNRDWEDGIY